MSESSGPRWWDRVFNPWMERAGDTRVMTSPANWKKPLKWNRAAEKAGEIKTVFCASLADVFEDWTGPILDSKGMRICHNGHGLTTSFRDANTPLMDHWMWLTLTDLRADLFRLIDATPHLQWLILTKRPENIRQMWPWGWGTAETADMAPDQVPRFPDGKLVDKEPCYRPNVALITSVSTQADADRNIPLLLQCRDLCPVLGVSAEPLVEAVDLDLGRCDAHDRTEVAATEEGLEFCGECAADGWSGELSHGHWLDDLDWVIAGGESGPGARPCRIEWLRDIVEQCRESSVPVFVKQLGSKAASFDDGGIEGNEMVDAAWLTMDPKGGDIEEFPEDLRVREFPVWSREEV